MPALGASLAASGAVGVASDLTHRTLPVHQDLAGLFPGGGLRRGVTIGVRGSTSLLLALLAAPTSAGSWAAVVGMPDLGVAAASELGVAAHRLTLVPDPGIEPAVVVAALLDGMDVVVAARGRLTDAHARRLSARARHRGAVLLTVDPWPGLDLELHATTSPWQGLENGAGHLRHRTLHIQTRGRGTATHPREAAIQLPAPNSTPAAHDQWSATDTPTTRQRPTLVPDNPAANEPTGTHQWVPLPCEEMAPTA